MKVLAQPHTPAFQTPEQFLASYAKILLGKEYETYQELKSTITPQEINLYESTKKKLNELKSEIFQFTLKVTRGSATPDDYITQQERDTTLKSLSLDEKVAAFFTLKDKIDGPCSNGSHVRKSYITEYNPKDRKIILYYGENVPNTFKNVANILRADGGIVKVWNYEDIGTDEHFDDRIYSGVEICNRDQAPHTWKLLRHAKEHDGFTLFFLDSTPLVQHCREDEELKTAQELKAKGKKIMIITNQYGGLGRFL